MKEIRCKKCNRLLFKGWVLRVDVKCSKCGYINKLVANPPHNVEEFYPVTEEE